jgi:predicted amino acid racemase
MLLRASLKDIEGGLENCDYLFLSDMVHLKALKGLPPEREVGVYLSVEAGDLREGALAGELSGLIRAAARFKGRTHIVGFAANYGCLRGFIPMKEEVAQFRSLCDDAAAAAGLATYTLSIGGTSIFDLLEDGSLKGLIDQVRIGEAIYFGYNMSLHRRIEGLHNDAFILTGEVMEVKEKLVSGEETRGFNAFGRKPESPWRGYRKRAILNFGELAAPTRSLFLSCRGPTSRALPTTTR